MKAEWTNRDSLSIEVTSQNSKSVLVIDTPMHCGECPVKCRMRGINHVPTWCPLRPLPEKMPMRDEAEFYLGYMNGKTKYLGFNEGYNACLEDILGGE